MPGYAETSVAPISVDDICLIANSFAEQGKYQKAVELYESASKIFPNNVALKINLGRVKTLMMETLDSPDSFLKNKPQDPPAQGSTDRFEALGEVLFQNGLYKEAKHVFELSKANDPKGTRAYYWIGLIEYASKNYEAAIEQFEVARKNKPFDVLLLEKLGSAYLENNAPMEAVKTWMDGFLVSGEATRTDKGVFLDLIKKHISSIPGYSPSLRNELLKQRREHIQRLYQEIQGEVSSSSIISKNSQPTFLSDLSSKPQTAVSPPTEGKTTLIAKMKQHLLFRSLDPKDLDRLADFTSVLRIRSGDMVYHEGDPVAGIYLIDRGSVELKKDTPHGPVIFTLFEKNNFFGDDNILSGRERFTSAKALTETDLLFFDKSGLALVFAREKKLAIHFLWYFWKSLSSQVRSSNERMLKFFSTSSTEVKERLKNEPKQGKPTHVEIDKKMEVLQTKGLNANELGQIARLSNEEVFNKGEMIFQEGDLGDRLYIVLEGSVIISKDIPGIGQEALAVLKKGDFFGEMALAGSEHIRSADAIADDNPTTLLVISRQVLKEILAIDETSAYQFLNILCRILSQRLLEINEKIYQWRMLSGSFE